MTDPQATQAAEVASEALSAVLTVAEVSYDQQYSGGKPAVRNQSPRRTIGQHKEAIRGLLTRISPILDRQSSPSVDYLASVPSQDSLRTYATAIVSHEHELPSVTTQGPISNLRFLQSCKSSIVTFTTAREDDPHEDTRHNCRSSLSALRGPLSKLSVCTANASVLTFTTARDYQEPLDLLAQSMLRHGTVPDTIIAPVSRGGTSPYPTALTQAPRVLVAPKPVRIALLSSREKWICARARLDPQFYVRTRQTPRRTGGSGVFSGLIHGDLLQTMQLPSHPFTTPFTITYGGCQLFGVGRVRLEYRIMGDAPTLAEKGSAGGQAEQSVMDEEDFLKWRLDCIVCREKPGSNMKSAAPNADGCEEEEEDPGAEEWDVVLGKGAMWV